jgi:cytochrome c oxidase subunit 2
MAGGATLQAAEIHRLWNVFLLAGIGVGGTTYLFIFWCVFRYRRKDAALPPQFRGQNLVEAMCTATALAIVAALFVLTYRAELFVDRDPPKPAVTIRVTGFQWSWRFQYTGGPTIVGTPARPPVMVVPVGRAVHIEITSADVDHAFFVPAFLFKRDAIPGFVSAFDLTVRRPGVYRGVCAEFCGLAHAAMNFSVSARSPQAFRAWLAASREARVPAP